MAAIDIDMSEFTQKTTLASTDFITGTLADGSAVKIKVSDIATVVAGILGVSNISVVVRYVTSKVWVDTIFLNSIGDNAIIEAIVLNSDNVIVKDEKAYRTKDNNGKYSMSFPEGIPVGYTIIYFGLTF